MEMNLDKIARGDMLWDRLCRECDTELVQLIKMVQNTEGTPIKKAGIKIDENHTYMIGKYGPVIKETIGDKTSFIPVKKDIDVKKLEAGEYSLSELIDEIAGPTGKLLGNYNEEPIYLKSGKYGLYVSYQGKNRSVSDINKSQYEIKLADVIAILERTTIPFGVMKEGESASQKTVGVVRVLSEDFTIRNGKYGHYIFYKTNKMTKPKFLNFKGYVGEYLTDPIQDVLQWINDKHFSK